jgi:N-acetylmuramoyl-L-alanine amidase
MRLILDAGHGGSDPGASYNDHKEKDITVAIVRELAELLVVQLPDMEIILSRQADETVTPGERQRLCMHLNPRAFISIHCNAVNSPKATGSEVIYREDDDRVLAEYIQESVVKDLKLRDRGIKNDLAELNRKLAVLSTPGIPSVIVEPGFISNPSDLAVLLDYKRVAQAIAAGVARWVQA